MFHVPSVRCIRPGSAESTLTIAPSHGWQGGAVNREPGWDCGSGPGALASLLGFSGFVTAWWLGSKRDCPKGARQKPQGLSSPRWEGAQHHFHHTPLIYLSLSSSQLQGAGTLTPIRKRCARGSMAQRVPQKAVSSNVCFRVIWNKSLHYPKHTFPFSVVRERERAQDLPQTHCHVCHHPFSDVQAAFLLTTQFPVISPFMLLE